jgi:hypothetical protein
MPEGKRIRENAKGQKAHDILRVERPPFAVDYQSSRQGAVLLSALSAYRSLRMIAKMQWRRNRHVFHDRLMTRSGLAVNYMFCSHFLLAIPLRATSRHRKIQFADKKMTEEKEKIILSIRP